MKFLFVYFILLNIILLSKSKELIFVELQSRHGARAPIGLGPQFQDLAGEIWDNIGELTGVGKRMEYVLGLRNRHRYITEYGFLSKKYDPHELLVFSTNLNRTLLSMTSQLQGLYPMSEEYGENLNEDQLEKSEPSVNIECDEIQEELTRLGNSSLPNYMTIIPIHMINPSEMKMSNYDYVDCKPKVEKITNKNANEKQTIKDLLENFKNKYSKNISEILPPNFEYNFDNISKICDAVIADYTEQRSLKNFFDKTQFNKSVFIEECFEIIKTNFRDKLYGDDNKEIILLEESTILRELIHYMKQRVDADIKGEKIEDNITDFSRPKMVIRSGHDTTLTAQILFITHFFNLDYEYELPTYSAQTAFEVSRDEKNGNKKLQYSDYNVTYFFNDRQILNIPLDIFINTIEKNIWTKEQIKKFCSGDISSDSDSVSNSSSLAILIGLITISVIALVLLIVIIVLIIKISKKKHEGGYDLDNDKLLSE